MISRPPPLNKNAKHDSCLNGRHFYVCQCMMYTVQTKSVFIRVCNRLYAQVHFVCVFVLSQRRQRGGDTRFGWVLRVWPVTKFFRTCVRAAVCDLSLATARVQSERRTGPPPTKIPPPWRSSMPTFVRRTFPAEIPVRSSYTVIIYIICYNNL